MNKMIFLFNLKGETWDKAAVVKSLTNESAKRAPLPLVGSGALSFYISINGVATPYSLAIQEYNQPIR